MLVFPNPANNVLTIRINNTALKQLIVEIMNIKGQIVYSDKAGNLSGAYNKQVDVSSLAKGVYYLQVKEEDFFSVSKIIIR